MVAGYVVEGGEERGGGVGGLVEVQVCGNAGRGIVEAATWLASCAWEVIVDAEGGDEGYVGVLGVDCVVEHVEAEALFVVSFR